jgi:hypothetical protein
MTLCVELALEEAMGLHQGSLRSNIYASVAVTMLATVQVKWRRKRIFSFGPFLILFLFSLQGNYFF